MILPVDSHPHLFFYFSMKGLRMTLTSKVGKFIFADHCELSKAKLIRDTVMGQILNPPEGSQRLPRDEKAIFTFVASAFKKDAPKREAIVLS
jgi:hypothetical protein